MSTTLSVGLSGNYKTTFAQHRKWGCGVLANGESWPRVIGSQVASTSDVYRLGIIPTYVLTAPTTGVGTSSPLIFGVCLVYRSTKFADGLSLEDIQGNRSNIVDVDLTIGSLAAVLTKVTTTDTKVDKLDVYAAQKIGAAYGTFYRVVKDGANSAGTITFSIVMSSGIPTGVSVTNGTADTTFKILATDNDYPYAQPVVLQVAGRLVSLGGITKRTVGTFTNGNGTVTSSETVYDGIEFWYIKRDSDTTGGVDGRGTYICRYATATTLTLVDATGAADTYDGTSGTETCQIWTEPNRRYSKLLNPHSFPADNVDNDYRSALLAGGVVPNTSRLLLMGKDFVAAEDYDVVPITSGLNEISTEYGCSSHFTIVPAHSRLYWLDLSKGKREICVSDGSSVVPISTAKIKSILDRVTLDSNGDVWRVSFLSGMYYPNEDTIRWWLYLDNNTVANYCLELDLNTGDVRSDSQYYGHRYLDIFTAGQLRGKTYVGQYGWTGGTVCRLGLDNVFQRYRDWAASGTLAGALDAAGQTTTVLTVTGASFATASSGLAGIQVLVWKEAATTPPTTNNLIVNPTYYHCRISSNTATALTINYVETVTSTGVVTAVGTVLPETPSGAGWRFAVGVIQAMIGPKWLAPADNTSKATMWEFSMNHAGQDLSVSGQPIRVQFFENFDAQPRDAQYMESSIEGNQIANTGLSGASFVPPKTNPIAVMGFSITDNNVDTGTTALSIETITVDFAEAKTEADS